MDWTWLFGWLQAFVGWLLSLVEKLVTTLVTMFQDLSAWLLDQLLGVAQAAITAMGDPMSGYDPSSWWAQVPPDIVNYAILFGLHDALAIVVGALIIRFGLQLIPFVRLGS